MPTRLVHVSDLHAGAREETMIETPLAELVERTSPALVVATGDLAHRGRRDQHERAHAFLVGLGRPVLAVPGNHDLPATLPARFTTPWREFERCWQTTEPLFRSDELVVVGLNSARPWRHQSGGLSAVALERARSELEAAPPSALRAVCLHHHLAGAPWRSRKRPMARRGHVLAALAEAGAELILAGHIHQSTVCERREFEVVESGGRVCVLATAPGLGQPRPRRRGEARGVQVYEVDAGELRVETYLWRDGAFTLAATRRFPRASLPI